LHRPARYSEETCRCTPVSERNPGIDSSVWLQKALSEFHLGRFDDAKTSLQGVPECTLKMKLYGDFLLDEHKLADGIEYFTTIATCSYVME